mgnify:CR=1 FL=1
MSRAGPTSMDIVTSWTTGLRRSTGGPAAGGGTGSAARTRRSAASSKDRLAGRLDVGKARKDGVGARAPELLLRCGTEDKYLLSDVGSYFQKLVTVLGGRCELVLEPGGHDWTYWRSVFVPFAADVARRLDRAEEAG